MSRRMYRYCAKGGHRKEPAPSYVCTEHVRKPGGYTHCAVCGKAFDVEGRDYVCVNDLAQPEVTP